MEAIQLENERLQTVLTNARTLLQGAYERLNRMVGFNKNFSFFLTSVFSVNIFCKKLNREILEY